VRSVEAAAPGYCVDAITGLASAGCTCAFALDFRPPRIASVDVGMRLLLCGVLPPTAAPALVQAEFLLHFFHTCGGTRLYAPALRLRRAYPPDEVEACLTDLAGVLRARAPGGAPCLDTAARHFVREFQRGALGGYTLDVLPENVPPTEA
jgi:ribosome biogenesis GTPase A